MRDPTLFAYCLEDFRDGARTSVGRAGSLLVARFMKAVITASEIDASGQRKFVVRNG